jgi:hypothetical protein
MITPKFECNVLNGELHAPSKMTDYISTLKDGDYYLIVKRKTKGRSSRQNKYYWGIVVPMIAKEVGYDFNIEVHEALKFMFLKQTKNGLTSLRSTSDLKTTEFEDYTSQCRKWASEFLNLYIPLPNEVDIPDYITHY